LNGPCLTRGGAKRPPAAGLFSLGTLVAALLLVSCSSSGSSSSTAAVKTSLAPIGDRIRTAYPTFEWPTRYQIDLDRYIASYPKAASFGKGFEVGALAAVNACSWLDEYLDARTAGDGTASSQALARFEGASQREDRGSDVVAQDEDMLRAAKAGDASKVTNYVLANDCRTGPFRP
jgi:hypothetical protein